MKLKSRDYTCICTRCKCVYIKSKDNEYHITRTNKKFSKTGIYTYVGHVDQEEYRGCFIPDQTNRMIFKKGELAPKLISCQHNVFWQFVCTCN